MPGGMPFCGPRPRRLDATDPGLAAFCAANAAWLEDYALFMALKEENRQTAWF